MTHAHKRKSSRFAYFRMDVPKDIQHLVGKTSWQHSLETTDPTLTEAKRAYYTQYYKLETIRYRAMLSRQVAEDADRQIARAFEKLAQYRGSLDNAVAMELDAIAVIVRSSWGVDDARAAELQHFGKADTSDYLLRDHPVAPLDEEERQLFLLRADVFEGPAGKANGMAYQELARTLLERGILEPVKLAVGCVAFIVREIDLSTRQKYDAIARAYLSFVAGHEFQSWPKGIRKALAPIVAPVANDIASPQLQSQPQHLPTPPAPAPAATGLRAMPISEALTYWIKNSGPGRSAINEATRAVDRFVDMFGDYPVGNITREMLIEYRGLISDLPLQVELAKVKRAGKTLRQVIDAERTRRRELQESGREVPKSQQLAPGTIKKDLGAFSAIFGQIASDLGDNINVAAKITVSGYSKTKKGQKRPRLPFPPAMMQALFDSPLFTGCAGKSDVGRTKPGDRLYQDELYWAFLFGVMSGPRLEEVGQIALSDVHKCDLRRTFGDEYDGHCTFVHITGTGDGQSTKNDESDRYVVIHDRLIELGFNEYVDRRLAAGKTRLFDLKPDKNGKFTKGLSQRLNRYLDRVVTSDARYVFHSTRHEFTDRAELSRIPTRVANSIKGHANATVADNYGLVCILAQYEFLKDLKVGFIDWPRLLSAAGRAS